jgi:hypothetical protein
MNKGILFSLFVIIWCFGFLFFAKPIAGFAYRNKTLIKIATWAIRFFSFFCLVIGFLFLRAAIIHVGHN